MEGELDGSDAATEFRAAQYVRMSTEHQQYSTHNQSDKIRECEGVGLSFRPLNIAFPTISSDSIMIRCGALRERVQEGGFSRLQHSVTPS